MRKLVKKYIANVKKPENNVLGRAQLKSMNKRHNELALWGLSHIDFSISKTILDIGCGGGKNISNLLSLAPAAQVFGIDYSEASVKKSKKTNSNNILRGRAKVVQGEAENLPYPEDYFDVVTAFETIYFWNVEKAFTEVFNVLKKSGQFLIVNEAQSMTGLEEHIDFIGFTVYTQKEIIKALSDSGFINIKSNTHQNGKWITVISEKP